MNLLATEAGFWTSSVGPFIMMVIGFGLIIFFHELGHFLAAKAVGIKVEEFALGFGKRIIGIRRGETDYRINLLPLGGYVKMLGQDDFKLAEGQASDPRAYNNRPIWARLCVVSAGVVMNVILAAILFMIVFSLGIRFVPAEIGAVTAGGPADTLELPGGLGKGLRPGDQVLKINGEIVNKFDQLYVTAALSNEGETFSMLIRRPGVTEPFEANLGTEAFKTGTGAKRYVFGIFPPFDRVLGDGLLDGRSLGQLSGDAMLEGDTVVSFAGRPIEHGWQIIQAQRDLTGEPIEVVVERKDTKSGQITRHAAVLTPRLDWSDDKRRHDHLQARAPEPQDKSVPEDTAMLDVLGLEPRMRVVAVDPDSPAAKAGILPGDIIAAYGDAGEIPTIQRFRQISEAFCDKEAPIRVLRGADTAEIGAVRVKRHAGQALVGIVPGYDDQHLVVAAVKADTPLAGKIPSGSTITAVNDTPVSTWGDLIAAVAAISAPAEPVHLTFQTPVGTVKDTEPIALAELGFDRAYYSYGVDLPLTQLLGEEVRSGPVGSLVMGVRETRDFIVMTYVTLQQYIKGRVSGKDFSGPLGVFRAGILVGRRGIIWLIRLLAIVSANLAVINFLPVPVVDGGHVVFLVIEKIRRRPLSLAIQNAVQVAGLVMIGLVFILLTYNDILQLVRSQW
ncbi:MAG: site-2 protease family protein [Planctomycetes bacterium]|nr:site-2 protease family protein [Planctomycetota bacterium]